MAYTPGDPGADARAKAAADAAKKAIADAAKRKALAEIEAKNKSKIAELEKTIAKHTLGRNIVKEKINEFKLALDVYITSPSRNNPLSLAENVEIDKRASDITKLRVNEDRYTILIADANRQIREIREKNKPKSTTINKGGKKEEPPKTLPGNPADIKYTYNIPMLKTAYLNPVGPQGKSVIDSKLITTPTYRNGRNAWDGVTPSRGTIQMSKMFAEQALTADELAAAKKAGIKANKTPYGFRFLYNPTDVTMAWGIVEAFSPQYAASGANGMTGVAAGLMKGTIAFTLLLNRIGDLNILDVDGYYHSGAFANDPEYNPNTYSQILYPAVGTQTVPVVGTPKETNPYGTPQDPPLQERAMIYKRGTMYDIEYLFRAMGGYYSDYQSGLNGMTADKGWLQPIPMELHLGAGLRYLVRVSSLDLKHMMFNERMVPILTTVNLVCTRYYDTLTGLNQDGEFDRSAYNPESPGSNSTS